MFSLVTERSKYLRIRKNVTKEDVISAFSVPVKEVFCGQIIPLSAPARYCYALAVDTYRKIAEREKTDEETLRRLNDNVNVYPTLRIWLP